MTTDRAVMEALLRAAEQPGAVVPRSDGGGAGSGALQGLLSVVDSLPLAVFWKDRELVYLGCNAYFARDAGLGSPAEIVGKTDFDLPWKTRQTEFFRKCDRMVIDEGRRLLNMQPDISPSDGGSRVLVSSKVPLRDAEENVIGVLGAYWDMSEAQRTEARLRQAERLASVGVLAAGVAHEINNPLAFILGNLDFLGEALTEPPTDPEALSEIRKAIAETREGAHRVNRIVRDINAFSKMEAGAGLVPVDVNRAIDTTLNVARHQIEPRATVDCNLATVPSVVADEAQLGQVILNLVLNAVQAFGESPREDNRITIRSELVGEDVVIAVGDTGPGIPPELAERIFEPFFTTKPAELGTGLGLFLSRNMVVDSFSGRLEVSSTPSVGTTFRIILPAHRGATGDTRAARASPPKQIGDPVRILVVDDEAALGRALRRQLGERCSVVCAESAEEALQLLEEDSDFALVLCDLMMPGMSGMELQAELASRFPPLAGRTVFMTGGVFTREAETFLADREFLQKPFEPAAVYSLISAAVARED